MITTVLNNNNILSFKAKTIILNRKALKPLPAYSDIYIGPKSGIEIIRKKYNFSSKYNSIKLKPYNGPMEETSGFSTNTEYAGGYLSAFCDVPLSTTGVATCAAVNLVDKANNKHFLYHVFHNTTQSDIINFIKKEFPVFDKVNFYGGEYSNAALKNVLSAINLISPNVEKNFFEAVSYSPEIVAYKGNLHYVKGKHNTASFQQTIDNRFC